MSLLVRLFFQLLSLLPFAFFHALGSLAAFILHRVVKYRLTIIEQNIRQAFPTITQQELDRVIKSFYRNFADTFTESIKMLTLSTSAIKKHCTSDLTIVRELLEKGKSVQLMAAHQFNWEYVNQVIPPALPAPYYFIFRTIQSPAFNQLFLFLRSKQGGHAVSAEEFLGKRDEIFSQPAAMILGADQNPSRPATARWMNFFGKPTPFHAGPAKGAIAHNAAMVMLNLKRKKRGYYHLECKLITDNAANFTIDELTWLYKKETEKVIQEDPTNYLWSHRRWRHEWNATYAPIYQGN